MKNELANITVAFIAGIQVAIDMAVIYIVIIHPELFLK